MLFGQRKGSHGAGQFAFSGGHLEYMEGFEACALREAEEECGSQFKIANLRFQFISNLIEYAPKHYTHIGMIADWVSGDPEIMEPKNAYIGAGIASMSCRHLYLQPVRKRLKPIKQAKRSLIQRVLQSSPELTLISGQVVKKCTIKNPYKIRVFCYFRPFDAP